jgi:hypothetical protein
MQVEALHSAALLHAEKKDKKGTDEDIEDDSSVIKCYYERTLAIIPQMNKHKSACLSNLILRYTLHVYPRHRIITAPQSPNHRRIITESQLSKIRTYQTGNQFFQLGKYTSAINLMQVTLQAANLLQENRPIAVSTVEKRRERKEKEEKENRRKREREKEKRIKRRE